MLFLADYVRKSWNPKAIVNLMEEFTPKNMRMDLLVNSLDATGTINIHSLVPFVF